jgi:hypothetical protein
MRNLDILSPSCNNLYILRVLLDSSGGTCLRERIFERPPAPRRKFVLLQNSSALRRCTSWAPVNFVKL